MNAGCGARRYPPAVALDMLVTEYHLKARREEIFAVVLVTSPAPWEDRREKFRGQWAKSMSLLAENTVGVQPKVVMRFVLGIPSPKKDRRAKLREEHSTHGDLVVFRCKDMEPEYEKGVSATTSKILHGVRWAVQQYTFDYFIRIGDDTYFRVDQFYKQVLHGDPLYPKEMAYIGHFVTTEHGKKYNATAKYGVSWWPHYAAGMGWVITYDMAEYIARYAHLLIDGAPEDAMVGLWLVGMKVQRIENPHFHNVQGKDAYAPCGEEDVLLHKMSISHWDQIDVRGIMAC